MKTNAKQYVITSNTWAILMLGCIAFSPTYGLGQTFKDCSDCAEMVVVPSGSLDLGVDDSDHFNLPLHHVTFARPFAIGKYEVTQKQWKSIMGSNPNMSMGCGGNCPVVNVSWNDVQAFIKKLNQKTGKKYRLPSESEWEYACHAGKRTDYCGSNDGNAVAWYVSNSETIHPVGRKKANAFGLFDMSGNVYEWVQDSVLHDNHQDAPNDGSVWEGNGESRVLRGGSWYSFLDTRYAADPDAREDFIGFRLARTLP